MAAPSPPDPPRHLPFDDRPHRLRMGLRPLAEGTWLEVDRHRGDDLAAKRRLVAAHPEQVLAVVDDRGDAVRSAAAELLERIVEDLARWHPHEEVPPTEGLHPIDAAGRSTQEDWCVHLPDDDGRWRLVAASVCFPTRWDLREKIGRTVREIHGPVPGYDEQLAAPVDAFFDRLSVDRGVWRLNWNLLDDPALHQPGRARRSSGVRPEDVGEQVWLRVERQTLVRLPGSGAVVFGIRVHVDPLASLLGLPDAPALLAAAIEGLSPATARDKGLVELGPVILEWLDARLDRQGWPAAPQNSVRSASRAPRSTS